MNNISSVVKLRDFAAVASAETAVSASTVFKHMGLKEYERARLLISVSIAAGGAGADFILYGRIAGETEWIQLDSIADVVNGVEHDMGVFDPNMEYALIVTDVDSGAITGSAWMQGYNQKGA